MNVAAEFPELGFFLLFRGPLPITKIWSTFFLHPNHALYQKLCVVFNILHVKVITGTGLEKLLFVCHVYIQDRVIRFV